MKLIEIKKASQKIGLDELYNALEEHAVQVTFDDFEEDGKTATAAWSNPEGQGDVKFTVTPKGVKVEARGDGERGGEDQRTLGVFPWQSAEDMASDIDEAMGSFAHDLDDEVDDEELDEELKSPIETMVAALKASPKIEDAVADRNGIDVSTKKGDVVRLELVKGRSDHFDKRGKVDHWGAVVQGQKTDIHCGEIAAADGVKDVLGFLNGITKSWYKENDPYFD
jgi:hypothetical protein